MKTNIIDKHEYPSIIENYNKFKRRCASICDFWDQAHSTNIICLLGGYYRLL